MTSSMSERNATTTQIRGVLTRYRHEPRSNSPGATTPPRRMFTQSTKLRSSWVISSCACLDKLTVPVWMIPRMSRFAAAGWSGSSKAGTVTIYHNVICWAMRWHRARHNARIRISLPARGVCVVKVRTASSDQRQEIATRLARLAWQGVRGPSRDRRPAGAGCQWSGWDSNPRPPGCKASQ